MNTQPMMNSDMQPSGCDGRITRKQKPLTEVETTYGLANEIAKRAERLKDPTVELAVRLAEATEFLEWSVNHVRKDWLDWIDQTKQAIIDTRQTKAAMEFETKGLLAACADVRKFFLSDDHTKEVQRLKEFVELCERLRALKADGTLDAVADTILKLS